ncbi:hypothetical protein BH11PSE9_BH11PSE9_38220 [soil metagenome]
MSFAMFSARFRLSIAALVLLMLGACATIVGPRTVYVTEAQLQALLSSQFPFKNRFLELLDVTVSTPRVTLLPQANRIQTDFEIATSDRILRQPYHGSLSLTYGVRFEPADNTIRLADVHVERFKIDGAPPQWQRQIDRLGGLLAEQALNGRVIHTLRPKDIEAVQGRGYRPGALRVTPEGLAITLEPM